MDQPTNTQTPHQHEPISFGIDQILNSSDQETPSQPAPRGSDGGTNYLGSPVSSRSSAPYPSLPGAFAGIGAPFEDSGSYSVNLSLAPSGVIRVPAHRPIPGAVPPPISSAIPAMPAVPSLGSLNFPWMESSRRFVKDRFTGKRRRRRRRPGWLSGVDGRPVRLGLLEEQAGCEREIGSASSQRRKRENGFFKSRNNIRGVMLGKLADGPFYFLFPGKLLSISRRESVVCLGGPVSGRQKGMS